MSIEPDRELGDVFALGNFKLLLHEVYLGDHFGDRVLNLEPGVHFHEINLFFLQVIDEFHGTCSDIINVVDQFQGMVKEDLLGFFGNVED